MQKIESQSFRYNDWKYHRKSLASLNYEGARKRAKRAIFILFFAGGDPLHPPFWLLLFFFAGGDPLKLRSYRKKQQEEIDFFETNVVVKLKTNPEIHIVPFNMTLTES